VRTTTRHPFGTGKALAAKDFRLLRGPYTQTELAEKLGLRLPSIQQWENGEFAPSMGNLRALLKHYNDWTSDLAGPALDLILPQRPKAHRRKKWQPSGPTPATPRT